MRRSELTRSEVISCRATECIHNQKSECMAGVISIKGENATLAKEALCSTFVQEGGYGYDHLSSLYDDTATKTKDIRCAAGNCKYNDDGNCYSDKVVINASNANCNSFECN